MYNIFHIDITDIKEKRKITGEIDKCLFISGYYGKCIIICNILTFDKIKSCYPEYQVSGDYIPTKDYKGHKVYFDPNMEDGLIYMLPDKLYIRKSFIPLAED